MFIGIFLFIFLLLFIPIPIKLSFSYINNIAKLKIYFKEIQLNKVVKEKKDDVKEASKKIKKRNFDFKKYITLDKVLLFHKKFKRIIIIDSLTIVTEFGVGDPANTALLFGVLNSCDFIFYNLFNYVIRIKNFSIKFIPDVNKKIIKNEINSIFFISLAKIIYILLLVIYIFLIKSKLSNFKEERKWKTTQ